MITFWNLAVTNAELVTAMAEVTDLTLPNISREFDTDRRVGYAGVISIPKGFGEMDLSFTTKKVTKGFYNILTSLGEVNFQFTGIDQGGTEFDTHLVVCSGFCENVPLGEFSAADGGTYELTAKINRIEKYINGESVLIFDPKSYTYTVNGVNQFANIRTALGI